MYDRISALLKLWEEKFPNRKLGGDTFAQGKVFLLPFIEASDDCLAKEDQWRLSIGVRKRTKDVAAWHLNRYIHGILADMDLGGANSELLRPLKLKMAVEKKRRKSGSKSASPQPPEPPDPELPATENPEPEAPPADAAA